MGVLFSRLEHHRGEADENGDAASYRRGISRDGTPAALADGLAEYVLRGHRAYSAGEAEDHEQPEYAPARSRASQKRRSQRHAGDRGALNNAAAYPEPFADTHAAYGTRDE